MRFARPRVPSFSLYGEQVVGVSAGNPVAGNPVHIEDIPSRSRKYLWQIGSHRHQQLCQLILVTAGPVSATLEDSRSTLEGPAAVIVPAGTIHGFRFRPDTLGFVLTMDLHRLSDFAGPLHRSRIESLFKAPCTIDLRSNAALASRTADLMEGLLAEYRRPARVPEPIAAWLACSILWTVAEGWASCGTSLLHSSEDLQRLVEFRAMVEAKHRLHWSVARYAGQLGVSEASLNRLCRRLTGGTAFDLIQQRLLLEAKRRLLTRDDPVSAVALDLGFSDSAYFSRFFRRHSGISPLQFRRRADGKVPARMAIVQG